MTARGEESSDLLKSLVGPPADEENEPAPAQGNLVRPPDPYRNAELEDLHVSIGKRIYAQLDMIIMAFNTINAVFAISAAVSLIPKYDYSLYSFCDYGDNGKPLSIGVQCPYLPSPVFISFLIVWCLYFLTIFSYRFHRTIDYWSNDLRFYVACDMLNNEIFMYIMVLVGIALTFVSAVGGIYFVTQNGSTASLGNILVFCGVNLMNLKSMLGGNITSVSSETHVEKVFPQPIFIRLPNATAGNLQGVLLNHRDVFGAIFNANTVALLQSNDEPLAKVGDVQQLRAAIYVLMPPELKK